MSNPYISRQPYQQITTSATSTSLVGSLLNDNAPPEINSCHPQHNDRSVRAIHPTSSLDHNAAEFIPGNSQHNVLSVRAIGEQHHNPWLNPVGGADNYAGDFLQTQQQNYWQNPTEYVAYQHTGDFLQPQQQNYWQTTAECEASNRHHQQFLQDAVIRKLQNPPPSFTNKTQQKNSTTDQAVNTFIQKINNLYTSNNKDINKKITIYFSHFKKDVDCLTDNHRKQLLRIIPTISEIIDKRNLDNISITTILYSLAKTGVCCKMNPNHTSENECIRYEQESINLIDKILTKILQTHEKHSEWVWSNIFSSLGLFAEQSPYLITKEQTNKLLNTFNFFMQKNSITELLPQHISNIFLGVTKLLKSNKLDSKSITTYSIIEYLLQQIRCGIDKFNAQDIAINIYSISNLAELTEFVQLIYKNNNIIKSLMLRVINHKDLNWTDKEISTVINGLGMLTNNLYFNKELYDLIQTTYIFLYNKMSFVMSEINIETSTYMTSGIIKLILNNVISYYKPSKEFIRNIILNKVIANPSIINTKKLYYFMHSITFFQEYVTKRELIWICKNINFFTPDVNNLKIYFISMGYLLVKTRKELENDKENKDLLNLEHKITTDIRKTYRLFHDKIENIDSKTIYAIYNTCSLVDEIINLDFLKLNYKYLNENSKHSKLEHICLDIIKTLIPNPENLQQEYVTKNLPPVDAYITYPDGSLIAIEIQGPGHYIDNEGKYPSGRHLLKIARLQKENIKVIEVNASVLMGYDDYIEIAAYLINLLLENHVEIRPEYKDNIPQLLQDAGITS